VFLEADDHAHLLGGIGSAGRSDVGRSLYKVVDNDLTGFVLEVVVRERAKRRHIAASHHQSSDETAERSNP